MGIRDEFTARKDLSRQRRYQLRRLRDGLCTSCGNARAAKGKFCEFCRLRRNVHNRESARRRLGCKKRLKRAESYAFEAQLKKFKIKLTRTKRPGL